MSLASVNEPQQQTLTKITQEQWAKLWATEQEKPAADIYTADYRPFSALEDDRPIFSHHRIKLLLTKNGYKPDLQHLNITMSREMDLTGVDISHATIDGDSFLCIWPAAKQMLDIELSSHIRDQVTRSMHYFENRSLQPKAKSWEKSAANKREKILKEDKERKTQPRITASFKKGELKEEHNVEDKIEAPKGKDPNPKIQPSRSSSFQSIPNEKKEAVDLTHDDDTDPIQDFSQGQKKYEKAEDIDPPLEKTEEEKKDAMEDIEDYDSSDDDLQNQSRFGNQPTQSPKAKRQKIRSKTTKFRSTVLDPNNISLFFKPETSPELPRKQYPRRKKSSSSSSEQRKLDFSQGAMALTGFGLL